MADLEADFRCWFEASPDVLLVLLPDSPRFTMVGATEARLAATHTTRETLGRGLFEVFPDDAGASGTSDLRGSLERVLATRAPDTMAVQKYDIRGPDGDFQTKYWSPKNLPVLSPDGQIRYILHRVEDVTDLVDLSRQRKSGIAELESTNRELDAFSYSVSHDLRAPLRAIDGFSRILLEDYAGALNTEARGHLDRICNAVARMATLIDALLELARISRLELRKHDVDLTALATGVVADLRRAHPERAVTVDIAPGLAARGDRRLLSVVLVNLIGNAWKFTARSPGARIEVARHPTEPHTFLVRDNGAGFDMAHAGRLFAPFQRLHQAIDFAGTGIGLATAQRVVLRHGGHIWAEAAVDRGAAFFLTLPP